MIQPLREAAFAALAITLLAIPLGASIDRGSIQGTVTDQQGAVVPGARVVVRNVDTNMEVPLTTNSAGFYLATQLVPGTYSVHVSAQGFSPLDIGNVLVTAGVTATADAELKVGATTQTIKVTAAPPLVQNAPSNFATVLQKAYVDNLPLQGRDIQSLVQLVPGVTQSSGPSGVLFGFNSQFGGFPDPLHFAGSNLSANGSQGGANVWYLDGSVNSSVMMQNVVINPSPDATGEFNVVDNGLAAEWGRTNGAVFNVVLKSGTNQVHGDLYEFNRNSYFSATNPFAQRNAQGQPYLQPWVNWNDFGGTVGGPVEFPHIYNGKDKTFFFVSYDLSFLHEKKPTVLTVPLPQERFGNFTGDPRFAPACGPNIAALNCIYNPYSTTFDPTTGLYHRTPFPTPVIPPAIIDPLAAWYASTFPVPNYLDPLQQGPGGCKNLCNNFLGNVGSSLTTHNFSVKVDHTLNPKQKLFVEWLYNPSYYSNFTYPWNGPTAQTQTGIEGAQPYRVIPQIATFGLTSTLGPSVVNELRVNFSRQAVFAAPNPDRVTANSQVLEHVKGLNFILFPPFQDVPTISVGGLGSFGVQEWQNAFQGTQSTTILDNLTKILGKHTIKTGFMYRRSSNWYNDSWGYNISFGGGLTSDPVTGLGGTGLAQFLTGATDEFGSYTGVYLETRPLMDYWGFYGQDEYRVTPNFSLNIGLRYDILPDAFTRERHNMLGNFNPHEMNPLVPFVGAVDYVLSARHPSHTLFPLHHDDLGPRVSFAWSPFGNHKTVVRGAFGIIYSSALELGQGWGGQPTPTSVFAGYNGDYTGQNPAFRLSSGAPVNGLTPPLEDPLTFIKTDQQYLGSGVNYYSIDGHDPYVEQWSFYIERQLPGDIGLSAGYVGTHGLHLLGDLARVFNYVPMATRQQLREGISNTVPVDASLGPIYGCAPDPTLAHKVDCPGYLVLRPFPQYQNIALDLAQDGINRYNSFQLKVRKRYSHGLDFLAAYTIQKNIESPDFGSLAGNVSTPAMWSQGEGRTGFVAGAASAGLVDHYNSAAAENPDNRNGYIALAPDDIPQMLNFAANYELPVGRGRAFLNQASGPLDALVGGWRLTQNWNFQSGVPMLFTGPCDGTTPLGPLSCRPNLIGNPSAGRGQKNRQALENQWYNPAAFEPNFGNDQSFWANPNPSDDRWWTFGNVGTRPPSGRMPGFWNADMALQKDFHISESKYFQFRWEVFNALNHQSLGVPNTHWCLPPGPSGGIDLVHQFGCQFGKITNVQTDPRSMEFALKFYW